MAFRGEDLDTRSPDDSREALFDLMEKVRTYEPEEKAIPIRFSRVARDFPDLLGRRRTPALPQVGTSWLAELGYCSYKAWHHGAGTAEKRPERVQRKLDEGTEIHERKVEAEVKEARRLPKATAAHLRNPRYSIFRIPEYPAMIRVGGLLYRSSIERAGRESRHLVVTEIKSGNYVLAPDHKLQVWGYCLSAPGALIRDTKGNFRAEGIQWALEYTKRSASYGPYAFTERTLALVRAAMRQYEKLFLAGRLGPTGMLPDQYGSSPRKCPACAFYHKCLWAARPPDVGRSIDNGKASSIPDSAILPPSSLSSRTRRRPWEPRA